MFAKLIWRKNLLIFCVWNKTSGSAPKQTNKQTCWYYWDQSTTSMQFSDLQLEFPIRFRFLESRFRFFWGEKFEFFGFFGFYDFSWKCPLHTKIERIYRCKITYIHRLKKSWKQIWIPYSTVWRWRKFCDHIYCATLAHFFRQIETCSWKTLL